MRKPRLSKEYLALAASFERSWALEIMKMAIGSYLPAVMK